MANFLNARLSRADLGGMNMHDHRLMYDAPTNLPNADQRSSSNDTAQGSTHHTGGRGSGQSASEEMANEDDDEDSSASKKYDEEDEEEDPDIVAPYRGRGKGKGKRPAIRVEPAGDDESQDEEIASIETGHNISKHLVNKKKRAFSNVSNTSLLFGENNNQGIFPRPKMARTLSHSGGSELLTYKPTDTDASIGDENIIESSDDERDAAGETEAAQSIDDDEDYSGVALISDDEDDVEQMEQMEETFIIGQEQSVPHLNFTNEFDMLRRASVDSNGSDFLGFGSFDGTFYAPVTMQDIGFGDFFEPPEAPPASPKPIPKRKFSEGSSKRVRFEDEVQVSDGASEASDELDSEMFPDLFLDQDKLPPSLYQLMEVDNESDHGDYPSSTSEHSFWDFGQDEHRNAPSHEPEISDNESSDPGSSGYETDMGDTTDEYDSDFESDAAPPRTPHQRTVLNRPVSAPGSKATSPQPFRRSSMPPPVRNAIPPLRGIFIHEDSRQAIAVTDRNTKALTFYRPRAPVTFRAPFHSYSDTTSTANNSPRTSVQQLNLSDSELSNDVFTNNCMNSTDIMLTGIFGSAPANPYLLGPPEAFYPFIAIGQNGNVMSDEDEYDDDDEFAEDVNIEDFMDFGSDVDATDFEQDDDTDVPATPATSAMAMIGSTPAQPTPMAETPLARKRANTSDAMLEHFDRAGVTAFRNNQSRFREVACLPNDPNLRASVSKPIRSGRSAEAMMSPLRKRSSMPKKKLGSSPFAGVSKATGRLQSSVMNGRRGPPRMGTFS